LGRLAASQPATTRRRQESVPGDSKNKSITPAKTVTCCILSMPSKVSPSAGPSSQRLRSCHCLVDCPMLGSGTAGRPAGTGALVAVLNAIRPWILNAFYSINPIATIVRPHTACIFLLPRPPYEVKDWKGTERLDSNSPA